MTCPFPDLAVSTNAAQIPKAKSMPPPPKSPTKFKGGTGGISLVPMDPRAPVKAM